MITKEQAMTCDYFHENGCIRTVGPRGGVREHIKQWHRVGRTRIWVRTPDRFRVPVKYGLYAYDAIDLGNAHLFHTPDDCPLLQASNTCGSAVLHGHATRDEVMDCERLLAYAAIEAGDN